MADVISKLSKSITLQGKTYRIGRLTIGDLQDFEAWVTERKKEKNLSVAKDLYGDNIPVEIFDRVIKPPTDSEIDAEQNTLEGVCFLFFRALQKENPDITAESIKDLITFEDLDKINDKLMPSPIKKKRARQPITKKLKSKR